MAEKTPPIQSHAQVYDLPVPPQKKGSDYLKAYESWPYAAINLIATNVAEVNLHLFEKKGDDIEEVREHESLSLLHEVNDMSTFYQLIEITQIYLDLTGEAYWAVIFSNDSPVQLWPLRPDWMTVKSSKEKVVGGYQYGPPGKQVEFEPEEVIPFKYPNPLNPYRGKGGVQAAAFDIDIDKFSDEYNRSFFFNSGLPGTVLSTEAKLTPEQQKRLIREWTNKFGGRTNAHKLAVLAGGKWSIDKVMENMKELDFVQSKAILRDKILATFGVSKANLGVVEDVNRANQEASDRRFKDKVVRPRMIRLVSHLNEFYINRYWPDQDLFLDFDNPVPEDEELKLKLYENGLQNGWLAINEVRERENLPPVEGGEKIYLPFNLMPIGSIGDAVRGLFGNKDEEQKGILTLEPKGDGEKEREFMMPIPPKRLAQLKKEQMKKKVKSSLYELANFILREVPTDGKEEDEDVKGEDMVPTIPDEKKEAFWKQMVAKTDVQEEAMQERLKELFEEQKKSVLRELEGERSAQKQFNLFNIRDEVKRFAAVLTPFVRSVFEDKAREIMEFVGSSPEDFDAGTASAQAFLEKEGLEFIKGINETTKKKLNKTLQEGIAEGEGVPKLSKRVESVYSEAVGPRSETIARTEVLRATNAATEEAYKQSGVVKSKIWLTALDERVDQVPGGCADLDQEERRLDEQFSTPWGTVPKPPAHPNCRCTIIPGFKQ